MIDLTETEIILPAYLSRHEGGLFVDLTLLPVGGGFAEYLDRLFSSGHRFAGLDYGLLTGLLYDFDHILDEHGIASKVKLAGDIVDFPPARKALYKAVKVDAEYRHAEYFFEPPMLEVVTEEPVYGEAGADGVAPVIGSAPRSELHPTKLDLDEFIAEMWLKDVRYGIDTEAVAGVIASGETVRMEIARQLDATEGEDAEVEEANDGLRRDNSPKKLANGQADLRKFQNRFPQIATGARLLKKKKRVLGKPGFRVNGSMIEPRLPEDFDLQALAGDGTRVENQGVNEFIVATRDGFLSLDVESNYIAVTEKIENKSGISVKTTGDLDLAGNEFIEHGEVQEGRVVEGKNMTFRADVYGDILSHGGLIRLERNLSNGRARSIGGEIVSNGRVLNSIIEAWEGKIATKYAEGCLIMAETVEIERTVNCEIIAKNVQIGSAEGCGIAGKVVRIDSSGVCRDKETIVSMLVPGVSAMDTQIRQVYKTIDECKQIIGTRERELALLKGDEEVARYLAVEASIRQGLVKLNAEQQSNWQKMTARFAKTNSAIAGLNAAMQEQSKRIEALQQEIDYLMDIRTKSAEGISCLIKKVAGDTLGHTMVAYRGIAEFQNDAAGELRIKLREQGLPSERVFFGDEGSLDWRFELPEFTR